MIKSFDDCVAGESYACRYKIETMLDSHGQPVNPLNPTPKLQGPGVWEGLGVVRTRDSEQRLVELRDTQTDRVHIVSWDDCWDIDTVVWQDPLAE